MYDVIIIGSGPAGLTAAIYTTRANLKTLIIAGSKWGGQLQLTTLVENYPGFPDGIQGPELMTQMRKQAERFGAEVVEKEFTSGDFNKLGGPFTVKAEDQVYEGKSVIIATGADTKWLGVPGEMEKIGRGVSSCAPCDAPFFRNKNVIVVGGGDSAMEEALVLTHFANNVIIVHRSDTFKASDIMQKRVKENPKIHLFLNAQIIEILGDQRVEKVKVRVKPSDKSLPSKSNEEIERITPALLQFKVLEKDAETITGTITIDGVFVAIGHIPNSKVFEGIDRDEFGFIKVQDHYRTNIEGVFVAGDVHDAKYKQAVTAAGFGCAAALEAEHWLDNTS
ncbi:MAG: thioredoxin-disulfide reductase [Patescibacteria group bacterium]